MSINKARCVCCLNPIVAPPYYLIKGPHIHASTHAFVYPDTTKVYDVPSDHASLGALDFCWLSIVQVFRTTPSLRGYLAYLDEDRYAGLQEYFDHAAV